MLSVNQFVKQAPQRPDISFAIQCRTLQNNFGWPIWQRVQFICVGDLTKQERVAEITDFDFFLFDEYIFLFDVHVNYLFVVAVANSNQYCFEYVF